MSGTILFMLLQAATPTDSSLTAQRPSTRTELASPVGRRLHLQAAADYADLAYLSGLCEKVAPEIFRPDFVAEIEKDADLGDAPQYGVALGTLNRAMLDLARADPQHLTITAEECGAQGQVAVDAFSESAKAIGDWARIGSVE